MCYLTDMLVAFASWQGCCHILVLCTNTCCNTECALIRKFFSLTCFLPMFMFLFYKHKTPLSNQNIFATVSTISCILFFVSLMSMILCLTWKSGCLYRRRANNLSIVVNCSIPMARFGPGSVYFRAEPLPPYNFHFLFKYFRSTYKLA